MTPAKPSHRRGVLNRKFNRENTSNPNLKKPSNSNNSNNHPALKRKK